MTNVSRKIALTIAGSDPSGGAGFQADLRTFQKFCVYGISVPSVLTAQSTEGVYGVHNISQEFVSAQLEVLLKDIKPDALKTGMLYTTDTILITADTVRKYLLQNLVIDPVTVSSTGVKLIEERGLDALREELFPLAKVITPNIYEAGVFTSREVESEKDMKEAAVQLRESGTETVIITGGHLKHKATDLFFDGEEFLVLESERYEGEFHGTGCVFASAVTACLALGYDAKEAFIKAKEFVRDAMRTAVSIGHGMKVLNV